MFCNEIYCPGTTILIFLKIQLTYTLSLGTNDWDVLSGRDQSCNTHSRRILQIQLLTDSQRHRPSLSAHHEDSEVTEREALGGGDNKEDNHHPQTVRCCLNLWCFVVLNLFSTSSSLLFNRMCSRVWCFTASYCVNYGATENITLDILQCLTTECVFQV